ncbi:hypothetical protein CYMTET_39602 [Cymbomonas tetramitiformis]|uniref:Uncharacterized protein n=1 Tax=Cymbomonas tetramitiformis TaxID=36881 RepID=A0AAE0CAZ9_9CHLO|nr:hypothetical protein CYMTET_39602 [Cymbomonas tetramitiformis]
MKEDRNSLPIVTVTKDPNGAAFAWIIPNDAEEDDSDTEGLRPMCIVPGQAIAVKMDTGENAYAVVRNFATKNSCDEAFARITWYEEGVLDQNDEISLRCVQSEMPADDRMYASEWVENAIRAIFDPGYLYVKSDTALRKFVMLPGIGNDKVDKLIRVKV